MSEPERPTTGQRLRRERQRLNWSQEDLAQEIGTTSLTINRWEHDRTTPRPRHRAELCRVFNKSADELFMMADERDSEPPDSSPPLPAWNVPYPRNLYFTGREAVLNYVHDALGEKRAVAITQPLAISGLGGIGKTQLAIEYTYRYQSEYAAVLWTRADSLQSLILDFINHANLLNLPEKRMEDQQQVINAVKRWLHTHSRWLLILDNADELELIYDFLSPGDGHILITTRSSITGPHLKGIELDKMGKVEGMLLLLRRSKRFDKDNQLESINEVERRAAEAIYELADGLPLALDQAAAYIEENQSSYRDYLYIYHSHRTTLLKQRGVFSARGYPQSVATTWLLSFEQIEQTDPTAAALLRLCAFLHPDAIPEEMLLAGAAALRSDLQSIANDSLRLDTAIGSLRRYSLIWRNAATKILTIHRLLQAVLRDALTKEGEREWAEQAVYVVNQAFPDEESSTWDQRERFLPHALACTQLIEQWQMRFSEAARLLSQAASHLYNRGQYREAETLCRQALAIREQALGSEHPDVAQSLNDLAVLGITRGNFELVEFYCQRALAIQEQVLGPDHADVAITLNDLAMLYYLQGRYEEVEPLYQRALAIFTQKLGSNHPHTATGLNNLAKLYTTQEKYAEAELLIRQAIGIREQLYGHYHPDVANSFHHLARLFAKWGRASEAEALFQHTLTILEGSLEPGQQEQAETLGDLARLLNAQRRYQEARPVYEHALEIYKKIEKTDHPDLRQMIEEYEHLLELIGQKV